MKVAALIPARAGSKRLPLKNIKPIAGKPLLFWSVDAALQAQCFSKIAVSSESDDFLGLVRTRYSKDDIETIKRPEELSTDQADLMDVCRHFLLKNPDMEYLCLMMPTYPFRDPGIIQNAILPALYSRQIDRVVSVAPQSYSTFDYWIKTGREFRRMFAHAPLWCTAGNAAYSVMRRDYYFTEPQKWPAQPGERVLRIQTDAREALDIDTDEDFEMAERLVKGESFKKRRILFHRSDTHEYALPEGVEPDEFKAFLSSRGVNLGSPILILTSPPPYFTFLRLQENSSGRNYYTEETMEIIASLPKAGHSQDFPPHFIHSQYYRILRNDIDGQGISESAVPEEQVILLKDLEKWAGYKPPFFWESEI